MWPVSFAPIRLPASLTAAAGRAAGRAALLAAGLALAACGGAGGSGPVSPSAVRPPPAPPAPAPAPDYDTAEYRRSTAAVAANVLPAWSAGASGAGVVMGFVDSGIDATSAEFAGRILPASRDVSGLGRGILDETGHGTAVAGVAAAARNASGPVGIAPAASLAVMRADNGDCTDGCRYNDSAIAAGLDAAVAAGARVINLSLGGTGGSPVLRNAFARVTASDVVLVVSAGNDSSPEVDPLATAALAAGGRGAVLVAGSVNSDGSIADFSNRAGAAATNYIAALGTGVRSFDHLGTAYLYSGTSFSAPAISAGIALLAQLFPDLGASQLVSILLDSADDAGAPGTDAVHGRGLLNIGRAIAPAGQAMLAGTAVPVPLGAGGALGSAFGTGLAGGRGLGSVEITDRYSRQYRVALGMGLRPATRARLSAQLERPAMESASLAASLGGLSASMDLRAAHRATGLAAAGFAPDDVAHLGLAQRGLDARAGLRTPLREARLRIAHGGMTISAASGQLSGALLPGSAAGGFVTPDAYAADDGAARAGSRAVAAESRHGAFTLAFSASAARLMLPLSPGLSRIAHQSRMAIGARYAEGPVAMGLMLADTNDDGAFMGTRLAPEYGLKGGRSQQIGVAADIALSGLTLRLAATRGWHRPDLSAGGLLVADGRLISQAWSAMAETPLAGGLVSLRASGPLVVESGRFRLANGAGVTAAADGREQAFELGWESHGLRLAAYHRADAGHVAGLSDSGGAITLSRRF